MERAIAIRERIYGPDHSHVGEAVGELARFHLTLCDYPVAEKLFRRAAELGRDETRHRAHEVTTPLIGQARCLAAMGRPDQAAAVLLAEREFCDAGSRAMVEQALAEIDGGRAAPPPA